MSHSDSFNYLQKFHQLENFRHPIDISSSLAGNFYVVVDQKVLEPLGNRVAVALQSEILERFAVDVLEILFEAFAVAMQHQELSQQLDALFAAVLDGVSESSLPRLVLPQHDILQARLLLQNQNQEIEETLMALFADCYHRGAEHRL
jgi:hypothetical protein